MKESLDQQPGHSPLLATASRQAAQSGGSPTFTASPKAARNAPATRPKRPARSTVVPSTCIKETVTRLRIGLNLPARIKLLCSDAVEPSDLRSPTPAYPPPAGGGAWSLHFPPRAGGRGFRRPSNDGAAPI